MTRSLDVVQPHPNSSPAGSRVLGWFRTTCLGLTCTVIFYACSVACAQKLPLWEAGLGVAPITFADYRGADEKAIMSCHCPTSSIVANA